jgi:hypothetical protein
MSNDDVLTNIKKYAQDYKNNLDGKDLLFIYKTLSGVDSYAVSFRNKDFLHLTGVNTNFSAKQFYRYALRGTLKATDFWQTNPSIVEQKINAFPITVSIHDKSRIFGEKDTNYGYRVDFDFASGNNTAFLGFRANSNANSKIENFPVTNYYDDINNSVAVAYDVIAVARKPRNDIQYQEITYISDDYKIPFPKEIQDKLTIETNSEIQRVSDDRNITFDDFHIERLRGTQTMSIELDSQKGGGKHFYSINLYSEIDRISSDFVISNELATTLFEKGREFSLLDESVYKRSLTEIAEEITPELPIEIKPPSPEVDEFDIC